MATIQKRDSENTMPTNTEAKTVDIIKGESAELKKADTADLLKSNEKSAVDHMSDCLAAWGAGRFNVGDVNAAFAEFFTEDVVVDATSAAYSGVAAYKELHKGFAGLKDWFDFVGGFDFDEMEMSHVAGTAGEVWLRATAKNAVWKATGKGTPFSMLNVVTWQGDKATKMTIAVYNPTCVAAVMSEEDVSIPQPVQLPAFEPHSSPLEPFGELMALWGAGELSKPEVRNKHCAADCVHDGSDSAFSAGPQSAAFKPYVGTDEMAVHLEHQATMWDMSNVEVVPVVGLKPGCVWIRFTCDVKHKETGKEAKGIQLYNELAYNSDGQFVYARPHYINAPLLASIY